MHDPGYSRLDPVQQRLCLAAGVGCCVVGIYYQIMLWQLDTDGLSLVSLRLPYWDFSNLWAGSLMVLKGHVAYLFDVETYRNELDTIFAVDLPEQEWSYPPDILLIGVPLALMPIGLAYAVWSLGTLLAFHLALRPFRLPLLAHLIVLFNPAIWSNQLLGQNGALTAALLIGGLYNTRSRPILAGVLLGLLTVKPHLGIIVPFCLLASRSYATIVSAAVTAAAMVVCSGLLFGFEIWPLFFSETGPLMTRILEAPYPQAYHTHAATLFMTMRSLGAGLPLAYGLQLVACVTAASFALWLWRPANLLDHRSKVAITGVLAILATPYGYTYDSAPLYLAVAWFLLHERRPNLLFFGVIWFSSFIAPSSHEIGISAGSFAPLAFAAYLMVRYGPRPALRNQAAPDAGDPKTLGTLP